MVRKHSPSSLLYVSDIKISPESRKHTLNVDDSSSEQLKRQKVDDLPRSRHWISGQMVVIQVDGAAFRLLSTQLEKQSPFFSALFDANVAAAPLDETGTRIFVVDVNGVTKSNFAALFDVIEDPLKYFDSPPPFLDIILVSYLLSFSRWHKWAIRQMEAFISTDVTKIDGTLRPFDQSLAALSVFRICRLRPFQKRVMYELVRRRDLFNDNDFLRYAPHKQSKIVLDPQQYPDGLCDSIIASLYLAREKLTVFWMDVATCMDGGFWVPHQVPSSNALPCSMPALQ